jgi:hypothetical protein
MDKRRVTGWRLSAVGAGVCLTLLLIGLGLAGAQTVRKIEPAASDTLQSVSLSKGAAIERMEAIRSAFVAIAEAWSAEDHTMLSELVAEEGVRIAIAPDPKRDSQYSPSQAFYFFKSLFQSSETDSFEFRRLQNDSESGSVHAMVDWLYHREGSDKPVRERLFFTLSQEQAGWGVTSIRAVR